MLFRSRDGSSLYYLLQDHLNSTSRIVTSSGAIQDTTYYFPFGGKRGGSYSSITTQRYTGQYHEQNLPGSEGLYYYGARWYDAQVGRFLSADTLVPDPGNPQDLNRYAYVRNSPLKYNDPSGHQASCMMNQDNTWDCNGNATLGGKTHQIDSSALSPQESSTFSETPFSPNQMEKLTELAKQAAETQLVYTEDGDIDWEATMESGAGDLLGACGQIVGGLCGLSFGASVAVFAVGGTGSVDLVADSNGDIAAYGTFGGGGYAVFSGWSARGYGGALMAVSNASVDDLKSWSVQFGGSAYYGTAGTAVEWITGRNNKGEPWHGAIFSGPMNAQAGWGAEIHATFTYSRQLFRGTPRPY